MEAAADGDQRRQVRSSSKYPGGETTVRTSGYFRDQLRAAAGLYRISTAEFADKLLTPYVQNLYRKKLITETQKLAREPEESVQ